jgi:polysaccharide biosynthesis transport protein
MNDSTSNHPLARLPVDIGAPYAPGALANRGHNPVKPDDALTPAFLWRAVQQWWKFALPVGLLIAAAGGAIVWFTFQPTYKTTAWLIIKQQADYLAFKEDSNKSFVQNQVELIRSPVVLEKVLAKPEIAQLPELLQQASPVEWLQKNLVAKNEGGSDIFDLSLTGPNAANVAKILNGIVDSYLEVSSQNAVEQTERVVQLLTEELERRGKDVERLRENLRTMARQVGGKDPFAASPGHDALVLHTPLDTLQERLITTQVERQVLEARLQALDELLSAKPEELPADVVEQVVEERPEVVKLKEEIDSERAHLQETERVAQPNYVQGPTRWKSQLTSDEQHLDDLRTRLKSTAGRESIAGGLKKQRDVREDVRQQLTNAKLSEKLLQERVDQLMAGQSQTGDRTLELEFAKHELDRAESTYQRIAERILALNTEMRAP